MKKPIPSKPDFCFIMPISYLEHFGTSSTRHLVLAHLVDQSPEYGEFYRARSENGDYIIMDNSAYELKEPYHPEKLIQLANICGADCVVLPDYPFCDSQKTIDAATNFAPIFKQHGFDTFFVPQSKAGDLEGWISCYKWAADNSEIDMIGMSILGIPVAMPKISPAFARVVMAQLLIDRGVFNFDKYHHWLGLNAGAALEIPSLLNLGVLQSVDSSGPVFAGMCGHRYTPDADSFQTVKKLKQPVDFFCHFTKDQQTIDRIRNNIDLTKSLFVDSNFEVWYAQE